MNFDLDTASDIQHIELFCDEGLKTGSENLNQHIQYREIYKLENFIKFRPNENY